MLIRGLGGGDWVVGSNGRNASSYEVSMLVKMFSLLSDESLNIKFNPAYLNTYKNWYLFKYIEYTTE